MPAKRSCANCEYSTPPKLKRSAPRLMCRRYAPTPHPTPMGENSLEGFVTWPLVFAEDWCGEFTERSELDDRIR
jgi:hypothetical protein